MGMAGIVIGLAPALGPTLSGWIIDHYTWRDLFGMVIPIVILVLVLATFLMKVSFNYLTQVLTYCQLFYQRLVSEAYYMVFLLLVMMGGAVLKLLDF